MSDIGDSGSVDYAPTPDPSGVTTSMNVGMVFPRRFLKKRNSKFHKLSWKDKVRKHLKHKKK